MAASQQLYPPTQQPYHQQPGQGLVSGMGTSMGQGPGAGSGQVYAPAQPPSNPQPPLQTFNRQETVEVVNTIGERETHHRDDTVDIVTPSGRRFRED